MTDIEDGIPTTEVNINDFPKGLPLWKLFTISGLCKSHSEAIRMAKQGGLYIINDKGSDIRLKEEDLNKVWGGLYKKDKVGGLVGL